MPDADRFAGLADALEKADAQRHAEGSDGEDPPDTGEAHSTASAAHPVKENTTPAFTFDEATAHSIYVRPDTLMAIDDVESLVDARLRTERAVRNLSTREFYDAVLRVAVSDPDLVIDAILRARGLPLQERD